MAKRQKEVAEQEPREPSEVESTPEKNSEYGIEIIRDYYGNVDPFYLSKKDPNYAYRFLRDEQKNLSIKTGNLLFQKGGWQICPKEHLSKLGIKDRELSPDGLLRRGDCILAFMPMKLYEEKVKYKQERSKEPTKTIGRLLKKGDPNVGGAEMHESMKGIQTADQLGM